MAKTAKLTAQAAPVSLSEKAKQAAEVHHLMNTQMADNTLASVFGNLQEAIATMRRRFLDDAERALETYKDQPTNAVQTVAHQIAWGNANATSLVETATRDTVTYSVCQANLANADEDPLTQIAKFASKLDDAGQHMVMGAIQEITDRLNGKA